MKRKQIQVTFTWRGITLTAEGVYTPAYPGVFGGPPDAWQPPEGSEFDSTKLTNEYGQDASFLLNGDFCDEIIEAALDKYEEEAEPYGNPDPDYE